MSNLPKPKTKIIVRIRNVKEDENKKAKPGSLKSQNEEKKLPQNPKTPKPQNPGNLILIAVFYLLLL